MGLTPKARAKAQKAHTRGRRQQKEQQRWVWLVVPHFLKGSSQSWCLYPIRSSLAWLDLQKQIDTQRERERERDSSCVFDLQSSPISQVSPSPLPLQLLSFRLPLLSSISRSVRFFQFFTFFKSIVYHSSQLRIDFVKNDSGF